MSASFTPGQHKMLAAAFQCFDAQPKVLSHTPPSFISKALTDCALQVDYAKLAELLGLKNGASAKTGWCALRKKLLEADSAALAAITDGGSADADGEGEGGKAKAGAKGKGDGEGRKRKVEEDEGERKDSASPAPAPKRGRKSKKATPKTEESEEQEALVKEETKSEDDEGVVGSIEGDDGVEVKGEDEE